MQKIEVVNKGDKTTEILFYGYIEYYGQNSSRNLSYLLRELDKTNDTIIIRMNSGGGSVVEAAAIYETIKSLKARVEIVVEGIAASAASFVLLAADYVKMGQASRIMIHKFSGSVWGNADDMRENADMMDKWENDWIAIYASKMKKSASSVKKTYFQRGKDSWIGAKDALKLNMVNEIVGGVVPTDLEDQASIENAFNAFQNVITNKTEDKMDKDQLKLLGLPENATPEQINARLEALKKAETDLAEKNKPGSTEDPKNEGELNSLKAKMEAMENAAIEKVLANAVTARKIKEGDKADWKDTAAKVGLDQVSKMLNALPGVALPKDLIDQQNGGGTAEYKNIAELMKKGTAVADQYRKDNPEAFNALWKASYGKDYTGS